jgi:2-hydroxy-6-oxonona-2,4-dienedioate hydrolase
MADPAEDSPDLRSEWTFVDGWSVHSRCSTTGGSVPFVLVHGLMISSAYMVPLIEELASRASVYAVDHPGFGRSRGPLRAPSVPALATFLSQWLDAAGIERCHVVAHSLGCQIVADLAWRFPHRLASLTLIGPTIDPSAHSIFCQAVRLGMELLREPPRLLLLHVFDFFRAGPYRLLGMIRRMFANRIEGNLSRVCVPALVLRGSRDPIAPADWCQKAARILRAGQSITLEGAAHCVHYTHPEACARAILAFTAKAHRDS